ncbi:MAG: SRPBCC domain-containing protein [Rhodospirillales bacterium]|nr:SRPBCC domain-containing protein [Alphaproteobacteria bacterium]MCB9977528.1 SRPBCC domain-containing protein [Rhodospirillales bacterium]
MTQPAKNTDMNADNFVFYIERTFDAPRERVWKAWTDERELTLWFGPKGCPITYGKLDFRVGGTYLYRMDMPSGEQWWGQWTFEEIVAPEKLVMITCFSNENAEMTRHPLAPGWPLQMRSVTRFTEKNGKTTISLEWTAYNANEAERQTFFEGRESMTKGWGGTFEQLEAYLAEGGAA